jgi:hypothetical protein
VCASHQTTDSKQVNKASELHTNDSINGTPGEFVVHHLISQGGKITSHGQNNFKADTIDAQSVAENQTSHGFSISGNVKNYTTPDTQVNHILAQDKQSRQISAATIGINTMHYSAEQQTVIYGEQGTHTDINHVNGDIETRSSNDRHITKNSRHNDTVVIPYLDKDTRQQFETNLKWAGQQLKLNAATGTSPKTQFEGDEPHPQASAKSQSSSSHSSSASKTSAAGRQHSGQNKKAAQEHSNKQDSYEKGDPWQQNAMQQFDADISFNGDTSRNQSNQTMDSWQQEAVRYYEHSRPVQKQSLPTASFATESDSTMRYTYQSPPSYEAQTETYFNEIMLGKHDYETDTSFSRGYFSFDEPNSDPTRLERYQESVSKPKDWHSSLSRWERDVVDDFDFSLDQSSLPESSLPPESSWFDVADAFGDGFYQSAVVAPLSFAKQLKNNPVETVLDLDRAVNNAARHPITTVQNIGSQIAADWTILAQGNRVEKANLLGNIAGDVTSIYLGSSSLAGRRLIDSLSKTKNKLEFFDNSSEKTNKLNYEARSAGNALRLKAILALQEGGILDETGKLTEYAIKNSKSAIGKESSISNPSVIRALTADGSNIKEWYKLATKSATLSTGQKIQVHFYKNTLTGEVNYTHPDFKVKEIISPYPKSPSPGPTINPHY